MEEISTSEDYILASRSKRLGAVFINTFLFIIPLVIIISLEIYYNRNNNSGDSAEISTLSSVLMIALVVNFIAINVFLIIKKSTTLGKYLLNMSIHRSNGEKCSASRIIFLRIIVNSIICSVPAIGTLYAIVDILFIFNDRRQCIHDLMSDTIVVNSN